MIKPPENPRLSGGLLHYIVSFWLLYLPPVRIVSAVNINLFISVFDLSSFDGMDTIDITRR